MRLLNFIVKALLGLDSSRRKDKPKDYYEHENLPPWLYQGKKFNRYVYKWSKGFVYVLVFEINNEIRNYIGCKSFFGGSNWKKYGGSSDITRNILKSSHCHLKERIILSLHKSFEIANSQEENVIRLVEARYNDYFLNQRKPNSFNLRLSTDFMYNAVYAFAKSCDAGKKFDYHKLKSQISKLNK